MPMSPPQLAEEIRAALAATLLTDYSIVTDHLDGFAEGIIEEIRQNALAGSRVFSGPHPVSGMTGASMASKVILYSNGAYPNVSPQLQNFCQGIVNHINNVTVVFYASPTGNINPNNNFFLDGVPQATNGSGMATEIRNLVPYPNNSPQLIAFCTAVADHINNNAEVTDGIFA